jgi:putative ABC transport system permease protein
MPHFFPARWLGVRDRPAFVAACTLTLALGIGACTTIFSILNAVVLRPMPFGDPEALVYVWAPHRMLSDLPLNTIGPSQADFFELERDTRTLSAMALFDVEAFSITSGTATDRLSGARVSSNFFTTLQATPLLGRTLTLGDDLPAHDDVVVISHQTWQRTFSADPSVVGRTLAIDRRLHRIVGVMRPAFRYPRAEDLLAGEVEGDGSDLWVPLVMNAQQRESREFGDNTTVARLARGASIEAAQQELTHLMARLDLTRTPGMQGWSVAVRSLVESSLGNAGVHVWMLFGAVSLVLFIACSNAAHLLLTRTAERAREMAIRTALGASRAQVVRHVLGESMALALAGGSVGVVLAYGAVQMLTWIDPGNIPRLAEASIDARVLLFSVAVSVLTGFALGLVPARWVTGANTHAILLRGQAGQASATGRRLRASLIVVQVALAMVLLAGAGLLLRSYAAVQRVDPGFSRSAIAMRVYLDERYNTPDAQQQFFLALLDRVGRVAGIEAVGMVDALPLSHSEGLSRFEVAGHTNEPGQLVHSRLATSDYFDAIGTPVVDGRSFREGDGQSTSTTVLVNQAFARRYFPGRAAVGGRFRFLNGEDSPGPSWRTVIGVVADVRHATIEAPAVPQVYSPWLGTSDRGYLVARSAAPGPVVIAAVRGSARAIDPLLPLGRLGSMNELIDAANARRRFQTVVVTAFAAGAWLLAAFGLYGLVAYFVQQRMAEIGIRLALGAQARDVMYLVIGQGMALTIAGLVIGVGAAFLLTRFVRAWLFEVSAGDSIAFGLAGAALAAAAAIACYIPTRRALRADITSVIRAE